MKKKIIFEIEYDENYDEIWNDGTGLNVAHEVILISVLEHIPRLIEQKRKYIESNNNYMAEHYDILAEIATTVQLCKEETIEYQKKEKLSQ